jgi:uncharacterized protein YceH (UPF0502 family)
VLCVLMLRGPQTPGELKQRTERLHPIADLDAVHATLERLIDRELAARLERRPGQKEERYAQLLGEDEPDAVPPPAAAPPVEAPPLAPAPAPDARVDDLEADVAALRAEVGELRAQLDALRADLGA